MSQRREGAGQRRRRCASQPVGQGCAEGGWSMARQAGSLQVLIARCVGVAVAATLALALWAPSAAHASGCTDTFTNTAGRQLEHRLQLEQGAPPASGEEACITENGTYTVTLSASSASVASLTVGGSSGTQTLALESNCSGSASLGSTAGSPSARTAPSRSPTAGSARTPSRSAGPSPTPARSPPRRASTAARATCRGT